MTDPVNAATRDEFLHEYVESYDRSPFYLTTPYDRIPELVSALRQRGIRLAVISNKPDPTVKQLIQDSFGDAFDIVEGAREGVALKPDPEAPLSICERLGVLPSETAYVGDTGTDMKTGKAYGACLNIGVSWGFRGVPELIECGATHIVSSPDEILSLIDSART
jgi:phosphoglycolate phosphatase